MTPALIRLDRRNAPEVQALFERYADFFVLTEGGPPDNGAAMRELELIVPGRTAAEMINLGVYRDGALVAFVELIENYPRPHEWWIALLLLDPAVRRRGFGTEIHRAIAELVIERGGTAIGIGVLEPNRDGEQFWRKLGYVERERQPYRMASGGETVVIVMSSCLVV
jgi:GNAT superfamily N-acetyltransferase